MKKILLGTTALVAATAVTAGAAKADMSVTGWNSFGLGVGNVEPDGTGGTAAANGDIDVYENGEIYFRGATEMDNGMTVSWEVQLETQNQAGKEKNNFIDENYFTIAGDFGSVVIGQENLPNYTMHYTGGMWVGNAGVSTPSYTQFTGAPGGLSFFHSGFMNDTAPVGNDPDMISYYTPRMNGFQLGIGYQPDSDPSDGGKTSAGAIADNFEDTLSIGANYTGDMSGTSISASLGYTTTDAKDQTGTGVGAGTRDRNSEVETQQAGLRVGFGGLTLGVSYMAQKDDDHMRKSGDTENFFVGATYATGAHTIGLTAGFGEAEDTLANKDDTEGRVVMLAHDYALGGGVSITSSVAHLDVDDESKAANADSDGMMGMIVMNAAF